MEDPNLIYEYEIEEKDVDFFEKLIHQKIDRDRYCYFLSCSE